MSSLPRYRARSSSRVSAAVSAAAASLVLGAALSLFPHSASACSISTGVVPFELRARARPDFARPTLPAPSLREVRVHRGTSDEGGSCGDIGSLLIDLSWPRDAPVALGRVGFYFKPVGAEGWAGLFKQEPVKQLDRKHPAQFSFVWIDPPATQVPMDFELDVVAVDERGRTGKPLRIRVVQGPPQAP